MNKLERLAYWKSVAVDAIRAAGRDGADEMEAQVWKDEDTDLLAYFDCFRPVGAGVEKVFAGIACGDEIAQRLLRVYECTKGIFNAWGYFIVRRPAPAAPERLADLAAQHLEKVRQIVRTIPEETELAGLFDPMPRIEIQREPRPPNYYPSDHYAPDDEIYEFVGDWFRDLEPVQSDASLLEEAFYTIACDYYIAHYLMWPLYVHSTDIVDPFAPYFELWTHGAKPIFEEPGLVSVFVSSAN